MWGCPTMYMIRQQLVSCAIRVWTTCGSTLVLCEPWKVKCLKKPIESFGSHAQRVKLNSALPSFVLSSLSMFAGRFGAALLPLGQAAAVGSASTPCTTSPSLE